MQTLKERIRCLIQSLPLNCIPKDIIEVIVENLNDNANREPRKKGFGSFEHCSSLTIVTNAPKLDFDQLKLLFRLAC